MIAISIQPERRTSLTAHPVNLSRPPCGIDLYILTFPVWPIGNPGIHNAGYLIDPPTYPVPDEISIRCSTTCPGAHGQTFDGENGMQFRMTCCKRHGVEAFEKEQMPTFQLCMQSCSLLGPVCSSVDYNERTGMCYYGKRSGEPTVLAPGWASASAIGCKGYTCREKGYCSATDQGRVTRDEL